MAKKVKITKGGQTVYPATVMDAVVHPDLRVDASKLIEEVNVSKIFPTGGIDGTNKYTLETAIAMIPASLRNVGIKCSFLDDGGELETWEYRGGTFTDINNWMQGSGTGGNQILKWTTDAATTRLQVKQNERKPGIIISYYNPSAGWINEQYSNNVNVEDENWSKDANWDRILSKNFFNEVLTASKTNGFLINATTGKEEANSSWCFFTANVSGFEILQCTVGFAANETLNVGLAFYDKGGKFISGYYRLKNLGYENVNLEIPSNAITAKWSWLLSDAPVNYSGEYNVNNGDITIKSSQVKVLDGTLQDFTNKITGKYLAGNKHIAEKIDGTAVKGTDGSKIYNSSWWSYSVEVIGGGKIACTAGYSASGVGIAFFDKGGKFISGYSGLKDNAYSDVVLDVPSNAVTAMWSWSTYQGAENNGEYELGDFVPIFNAKSISYNEETQDDFNRKVDDFIDGSKYISQQGNAGITASSLISASSGDEISNNSWLYFTANVSGFETLTCVIGFSNNESLNVGLAFYDSDGRFVSGYYKLEERGYENVNLEIPNNAVTAKWSWLTASAGAPVNYNGEYTLLRAKNIADEDGVVNHNTPNLIDPTKLEKTFNDGKNSFTPPNDGYSMSNRISAKAGDWFTRTGTETGMIVVTDENDTNGQRLFAADGITTLGASFQIPNDMTWVRYIRMAVNEEGATNGDVVICKGKYAFTGDNKGDFITIPKLRIEKSNLTNDILYVKNENGSKLFQIYVDSDGNVKAKEVNPDVIPDNELPENWKPIQLAGDFHGYFDRFTIMNTDFLIDLSASGPVRIKQINPPLSNMYSNFEHFYVGSEERFVVDTLQNVVPGGKGITIFDGNFNMLDTNISGGDIHDFVFINDSHIIILTSSTADVNIPGGSNSHIEGISAIEMKKTNGVWKGVGTFNSVDYPQLCTDAFGNLDTKPIANHQNTIGLDYDGNLILNMRNWESWIKIRRVDNGDDTYTLGSTTKNYDEAVIGRVGGRHNSGYIDSKRVLNEGFNFTDAPSSLTEVSDDQWEEWQWFHCHDVKYWGMKNIGGHNYPTYTLFDNNMWTAGVSSSNQYNATNKHNNNTINPNGAGNTYIASKSDGTYDKYTCSRIIQLSIDWDNHLIKDYRVYIIPKLYSSEQCGATMYDEGIISISYSYHGLFGLWDFTTEETEVDGHIYTGAKQLFLGQYDNYNYCYRANTYKKI